jgi:hypothetical protein
MQSTLEFGAGPADLTITVSGLATRDEFVRLYRGLPEHPGFHEGMTILLDFWGLSVVDISEDDARAIGRALADEESRYGRALLAVFAPRPVVFELTRLAEMSGGFDQIEVSVSDSYEEATAWLVGRGGAPPPE